MADEKITTHDNRIRKLRKKLRQIENLHRLCGSRELTEDEAVKVIEPRVQVKQSNAEQPF